MSRQYYYLITSLPDIRLDDYKEPYRVNEFVRELSESLDPEHAWYARQVLYFYDIGEIASIVSGTAVPRPLHEGNLPLEQIKEQLAADFIGERDPFIAAFLQVLDGYKAEHDSLSMAAMENLLLRMYYRMLTHHRNAFIRRFFTFDYYLRNVLIALNARTVSREREGFLVLNDEDPVIEKLMHATAQDFGLARELEYLPKLMEIFAKPDLIAQEKFIDSLRWDMVDAINTFKYFDIDVLLGYLVKLMLVERWISLDEHRGGELLEEYSHVATSDVYP